MADCFCTTCFSNTRFPRTRYDAARKIVEQCVDPCHDVHVLEYIGQSAAFLRKAIKGWRGLTAVASKRMYGTRVPPTLASLS